MPKVGSKVTEINSGDARVPVLDGNSVLQTEKPQREIRDENSMGSKPKTKK